MSSSTCKHLKFDVNSSAYAENVESISHKFAAIRNGKWRHKEPSAPSVTVLGSNNRGQVKPVSSR